MSKHSTGACGGKLRAFDQLSLPAKIFNLRKGNKDRTGQVELGQQVFWGSVFLGSCLVVQVAMVVYCSLVLKRMGDKYARRSNFAFLSVMTVVTILFIVVNHTIQVWIWSFVWIHYGVFADWNLALYFSMVTYATIGYGDVVLGDGLRIFGAFAGITGILAFGISTAFLVAVMTRILPGHVFSNRHI